MAHEIRLGKVQFSELQKPRDLDLGSGYTAYRRASLIDLYLHTKFHWDRTNFLWMDGHTYICTYLLTDISDPLQCYWVDSEESTEQDGHNKHLQKELLDLNHPGVICHSQLYQRLPCSKISQKSIHEFVTNSADVKTKWQIRVQPTMIMSSNSVHSEVLVYLHRQLH